MGEFFLPPFPFSGCASLLFMPRLRLRYGARYPGALLLLSSLLYLCLRSPRQGACYLGIRACTFTLSLLLYRPLCTFVLCFSACDLGFRARAFAPRPFLGDHSFSSSLRVRTTCSESIFRFSAPFTPLPALVLIFGVCRLSVPTPPSRSPQRHLALIRHQVFILFYCHRTCQCPLLPAHKPFASHSLFGAGFGTNVVKSG
ncbi:hypothetical protein FB451DRAFT_131672 [Mycena latifolia]|nr:hypothetical protein FB451DRAFT_131672 [Mycena latifolia]